VTAAQPVPPERLDEKVVSVDVRRDGIAVVSVDGGRDGHHAPGWGAGLRAAVDRIEEDASIAAAVLTSGKSDDFVVGTAARRFKSIKYAADAERMARDLAQLFGRLASVRKPVVAAVHGRAVGVGFELALACHAIVASDDRRTVFGFPEVRLGLIPAGDGLLRVARRAGLRAAIQVALSGDEVRAAEANEMRLVDEVCPRPIVLDVAARYAKALVGRVPRAHAPQAIDVAALALERNPVGRRLLFRWARERVHASTRGHYPAPGRLLDVLERLSTKGFEAAADLEAKSFGGLVVSETAHRLVELSFSVDALEKDPGVDERVEPRTVERVAVLGGGLIGTGVACTTVMAGVPVRLKERDHAATGRALRKVKDLVDACAAEKKLGALERDRAFARLSTTAEPTGFRNVDLVLEAVFEDLALKQSVLREVEALVEPTCVIASSTSSIPVAAIAQAAARPERVLGMHYFSPVPKMRLLEVVRADKTARWAVATAVALGKRQGKVPIVVADGPGFYTTRVLAPLLNESVQLVEEGVAVEAIDAAMTDWGFPIGPIQLLDEVGIDVAAHVAQVLHVAYGARMTPPGAIARLMADDRMGRKNGRGFYRRGPGVRDGAADRKRAVDPGVYAVLGTEPRVRLPAEAIQMRCVLAMTNEAVRCSGEGVLRCARDGDVGAVFGLGFPPFRGGPFRYVDTIGAAEVLRRVQGFADRFGERWKPAPLLVQMAKKGDRFYP